MSQDLEDKNKRFESLKTEHNVRLPAYKDLQTYINQTRGIFKNDRSKIGTKIDHKTLIHSYATQAQRIFASGLNSGMTNKASEWFRPTLKQREYLELPGVRQWLDDIKSIVYSILNDSNIYGCVYNAYEEMAQFGPACFIVLEDYDDVVRGRSFTAGEYYLATDFKGRVNTFAREFQMTVAQVVSEFGIESCSDQVIVRYKNKDFDAKVKIRHIIEPNKEHNPDKQDNMSMPYASCYWEDGNHNGNFLARRGFKYFPVIAPRWETTTTDDVYGYGPGWHALGSIKELQKTRLDKIMSQEKSHNPPTQQDASVEGHANLLPGGVTKSSSVAPNAGVRAAYQISVQLESFIQLMDEEKEEIDRFFFVNLFLMLMQLGSQGEKMTATEVAERQQEKIMMMGPALHKLDEEMLTPLLEIIFTVANDNGLVPPPPPGIEGLEIEIEYTSILAQAQKAAGITNIERVLALVPSIAAINPSILDIYDVDEMGRQINDMAGAPAKIVLSPEKIKQVRAFRQQKEQAIMAMQAANSGADTAAKLASAKTDEPSALTGLMKGLPGAQ